MSMYTLYNFLFAYTRMLNWKNHCQALQNNHLDGALYKKRYEDMNNMKVYSEHCIQNIVNNNKIQYKQDNSATILQSAMFEKGKYEDNDCYVNLPLIHI